MDEYVIVRYPSVRRVFVDGEEAGRTNEPLTVERGTHKIDLGPPANYAPSFRRVQVVNTNLAEPREVIFAKA